ncbi:MAG: excisionase family DNA-binding protein, partial [Planctomycetota bacterium]
MAKMFYTLDEAAEKLGVQPDAVKEMAAEGKLQQFRDRDKLMFKRDQVDGLAASAGSSGAIPIASDSASGMSATGSSMILLDDSGDTKIDDTLEDEDPREASG